jgi:hypothetical protein
MELQQLIKAIDQLPPEDFKEVYRHVLERKHNTMVVWEVPQENIAAIEEIMRPVHEEAAQMSEEEVNAAIDEAIAEVRRERQNKSRP